MSEVDRNRVYPTRDEEKQRLKEYVRGLNELGIRLTPLTEDELREMTVDQLYSRLADHEQISSEFSTAGGVIVQQMEHRALVRQVYIEKVLPELGGWPLHEYWDSKQLNSLTTDEIYDIYRRTRDVQVVNMPMEF